MINLINQREQVEQLAQPLPTKGLTGEKRHLSRFHWKLLLIVVGVLWITMATANRMWSQSGQYTSMTSGNNYIPGGSAIMKVVLSGTAAANINAYQAIVTIPTLPVAAQAN